MTIPQPTAPQPCGEETLLPCPFCPDGGIVRVAIDYPDTALCLNCRASNLIAYWNRRTDAPLRALVAELEGLAAMTTPDAWNESYANGFFDAVARMRAIIGRARL